MRFGVLGTGFWAKEVHAAALAAHPSAELVGVWGRDLAKAKAVGARVRRPGLRRRRRAAGPGGRRRRSRCRPTSRRRWPCARPRPGKHLLLEKPIALNVADADRLVTAVQDAGVASVVFFTLPVPAGDVDLAGPRRPAPRWPAGGLVARLAGAGRRSTPRPGARSTARCGTSGPHALSLLVPALGPVVSVQAGAGLRDTVHLVLHARVGRRLDRVAVAHGRADVGRERVLRARGRRPAGAAAARRCRGRGLRGRRRRADRPRLTRRARTRATSEFGRDVVCAGAATRAGPAAGSRALSPAAPGASRAPETADPERATPRSQS